MVAFRLRVARGLEDARGLDGPLGRALAAAWRPWAIRGLIRPATLPTNIDRAICVGGATLGGSGKTRVAIAVARLLKEEGESVAFVAHGYRAAGWLSRASAKSAPSRRQARVVRSDDAIEDVGDEALVSARALSGAGVPVLVAPTRQEAIDAAAKRASTLVIDGPLRITDDERCVSVLAVDAHAPWGAGHGLPRGDLKAPREALEELADVIVPVDAAPSREQRERLIGARVGLFTAIARPARLVAALERAGIELAATVHAPDHGPLDEVIVQHLLSLDERRQVDVWTLTEKCALHLERRRVALKTPSVVLSGRVEIPVELHDRMFISPKRRHTHLHGTP